MADERDATLKVLPTKDGDEFFVSFDASNSETLGVGETHPNIALGNKSRSAWITGMIQVLKKDGYKVLGPGGEEM